jgi:hypothetical protein
MSNACRNGPGPSRQAFTVALMEAIAASAAAAGRAVAVEN